MPPLLMTKTDKEGNPYGQHGESPELGNTMKVQNPGKLSTSENSNKSNECCCLKTFSVVLKPF